MSASTDSAVIDSLVVEAINTLLRSATQTTLDQVRRMLQPPPCTAKESQAQSINSVEEFQKLHNLPQISFRLASLISRLEQQERNLPSHNRQTLQQAGGGATANFSSGAHKTLLVPNEANLQRTTNPGATAFLTTIFGRPQAQGRESGEQECGAIEGRPPLGKQSHNEGNHTSHEP